MLLSAVTGAARALPLSAGYRLADLLSGGHRALSPSRRRAVRANLRAVRGDAPGLDREVGRVFRNYGRFLFEFLRGVDVPELEHRFLGRSRLEGVLERGRGVILATLHTGNWQISGARLAGTGLEIHAVAGIQLHRAWTVALRARQAQAGIRILPPGLSSWKELQRILARNGALTLLVDGNIYGQGVPVTLRGRAATFPIGPARLAGRTGAGLLPVSCERCADGSLRARFLEEVPVPDDSPAAVARASRELAGRFDGVLGELSDQWLLFRRFFREDDSS